MLPFFQNEIDWGRGATKESKNNVIYQFKNGSSIDILAARETSRGQRRTGGLVEEVILVDKDALNEIIIPTTNIDRRLSDGTTDPDEVVNQSQIYITSAGWKNSFPYAKLIEILINSILDPDNYIIMGGDYRLAILEGAAKKDFVNGLKLDGTYNADSFDREYGSIWSGDVENAFYSSDEFDKNRVLNQPEYEYSGRSSKSAYYVLGVDVGRKDCQTEVAIFKVTPQPQGDALKSLVNIVSLSAEHFEEQAINIKKLFFKYKAQEICIDANGLGVGLVDMMVLAQIDPETGEELPPFGVSGGTYEGAEQDYKKIRGGNTVSDALYLMKANAPINTEAYTYCKTQLSSGKVKMLIDEGAAKTKLMGTRKGQNMDPVERNEYLKPFNQTSNLKNQILNLVEENEGVNIILKQSNRGIPKDKFSAFIYGLYLIKIKEEKKKKKRGTQLVDMLFFG